LHSEPWRRVASAVLVMSDDDRWALRAELESRREEIATLRGVVAALRGVTATSRGTRKAPTGLDRARTLAVGIAVGALLGFSLALALLSTLWRP
jgi:hypothetical protein